MASTDSAFSRKGKIELFLDLSVLRYSVDPKTALWSDHGGPYPHDTPERWSRAAAILAEDPGLIQDSIHTAVVAQDVERVRAFLEADASLASSPHEFDGWQPLMRLTYARLPSSTTSPASSSTAGFEGAGGDSRLRAPVIAKLLLDAGAEPGGGPLKGDMKGFTALTGAIGGGEYDQPTHPQGESLARLLIEYGADPLDGQALYNTSLAHNRDRRIIDGGAGSDETFWLDFLWAEDIKRCMKGDFEVDVGKNDEEARKDAQAHVCKRWQAPLADGTLPAPPLVYLLHSAVRNRQPKRVKWLLEHGGDAYTSINIGSSDGNGGDPRSITLVEAAEAEGYDDIVELLVKHGNPGL